MPSVTEIYTDGSNNNQGIYSYGMVVVQDGEDVYSEAKVFDNNEYSKHRNVAGELSGAIRAIEYALLNDITDIVILADYHGVARIGDGTFNTQMKLGKLYRRIVLQAREVMNITFKEIPGHSGIKYNEMADKLAGAAIKDYMSTREDDGK